MSSSTASNSTASNSTKDFLIDSKNFKFSQKMINNLNPQFFADYQAGTLDVSSEVLKTVFSLSFLPGYQPVDEAPLFWEKALGAYIFRKKYFKEPCRADSFLDFEVPEADKIRFFDFCLKNAEDLRKISAALSKKLSGTAPVQKELDAAGLAEFLKNDVSPNPVQSLLPVYGKRMVDVAIMELIFTTSPSYKDLQRCFYERFSFVPYVKCFATQMSKYLQKLIVEKDAHSIGLLLAKEIAVTPADLEAAVVTGDLYIVAILCGQGSKPHEEAFQKACSLGRRPIIRYFVENLKHDNPGKLHRGIKTALDNCDLDLAGYLYDIC